MAVSKEPVAEPVVMIPESLMGMKEVVANSDLALKSQICSLLDQAIQLSIVK